MPAESQLCDAGLRYETLVYLAGESGVPFDDVYAAFLVLYSGKPNVASTFMTMSGAKGYSRPDVTSNKAFTTLKILRKKLAGAWITPRDAWIKASEPHLCGLFDHSAVFATDTVPIPIDSTNGCYQPKYEEYVAKVCVTVLLNGYVVHWGEVLYTGASDDTVIGKHCGVLRLLEEHNKIALVDGGFQEDRRFIRPFSKPQIYPKRLRPQQSVHQYKQEAHEKKVHNKLQGHIRGRAEHFFGRSLMGRFSAMKDWRWNHDALHDAIACILLALNVECFLVHKDAGRYPLPDEKYINELRAKGQAHTQQDKRYPESEPLPALKSNQKSKRNSSLRSYGRRTVMEVADDIEEKYVRDSKRKKK